jgi:hypothetical protein
MFPKHRFHPLAQSLVGTSPLEERGTRIALGLLQGADE